MITVDQFTNFFKYYVEQAHQVKAVHELYKHLPNELKDPNSSWIRYYRNYIECPPPSQSPDSTKPDFILNFPWYPQTDNFTQANRTCNSSSCAMALKFLRPNSLSDSPTADDEYLKTVMKFGDTTYHEVQTKALRAYGLESEFRFNLDFSTLDYELHNDRPVVIAILHRGPVTSPTGGHIIVCIGHTPDKQFYYFNDPFGDLNSNYSTHVSNGRHAKYSRTELQYRWLHKGKGTGWGRIFKP